MLQGVLETPSHDAIISSAEKPSYSCNYAGTLYALTLRSLSLEGTLQIESLTGIVSVKGEGKEDSLVHLVTLPDMTNTALKDSR